MFWLHRQQRKIRKRQYELIEKVTAIKEIIENRFNGAIKDLRSDLQTTLQTTLTKMSDEIGKTLDKHEGTLDNIDQAVGHVALKSGTTDAKHDGEIKGLETRVKRIEDNQDRRQ